MDINMHVNELPARTYRWLKLNGEDFCENNIEFRNKSIPVTFCAADVKITENADAKTSEEIFQKSYDLCAESDKGALRANGDTSVNHDKQIVRTGMGIDVDNLLESADIKVTLIQTNENTSVTSPVILKNNLSDKENTLSRQVIIVPDGATMSVIMQYDSEDDAEIVEGVSTKFYVGKNATLNLVKIQMLGKKVRFFDDIGGVVEEKGCFNFVSMQLGAAKAYNGLYVNLLGKESQSNVNCGYLASGNQFYDFNYVALQRGVKTVSNAVYRGILIDNASKNWRGSLDFRKGSSGSVGDEQEDTLLLSENVVNRTIPLILCGEEDVDGRHGATIGQLSDDMLFYMEARGIDKENAKKIMVRARLDSIARMIPDGELRNNVGRFLDSILN